MKRLTGLIFSILLGFTLTLSGVGDAYAKRLGGGKSFGSRPSYSDSYRRDASPPASPVQQPGFQAAPQKNQAIRDSLAQRGGFMRMLGGLALGGLLGAMLFGGAFENLNFLDILTFALIAFLLYKFFAARRRSAEPAATGAYSPAGYAPADAGAEDPGYRRQTEPATRDRSDFNTDILFGKNRPAAGAQSAYAPTSTRGGPSIPADFDTAAFMSGAETAYRMMQQAWDEGDLAQLRSLTTDKVFGELQDQLRARGATPNRTELLKVELELLEVRDTSSEREATVLFDVLLREAPGEAAAQVREVWHFVRPLHSRQLTWFLDGIQQLEE